jgi:transcriptional regulatory protein LevR
MNRETDVKINQLMKEKAYLEAKLDLIVKELRLTVLKNSITNVNAHHTIDRRGR